MNISLIVERRGAFFRLFGCLLTVVLPVALLGGGVRADDGIFPPAAAAKPYIDFDGRGFLIDGKRTPIISAGMEYARVPRALWRDRLLRFKRAGFNCVEMYTFWNWHEPKEGQFDFRGDHDLDAYLKLVHSLGMYAIVRVGPYYCAEWDSGGYPVWLRFKPGVRVREDNSQFEAAVDQFFDKLIPIVAANQINRGGAVVLVQLENEHPKGWGKEMPNGYFTHLRDKAVALGLQVPYFFSGLHHGGDPAGNRSWDSVGRTNPWFTTEFWSVWYDHYGPHPEDADEFARRTWKVLAYGGSGYNFYMAHGGTNFGYTNNNEDAASYDYGAAVGQAGDLRPVYYRLKRAGLFARSFPEVFEDSVNADKEFADAATEPSVRITARKSPGGSIVFLDNPGKAPVKTQVKGPDGQAFPAAGPMTLAPGEIMPVVEGAALTPHITLTLAAARVLGVVPQGGVTTVVVYGPAGDPGELRLAAPAGAKTSGAAGAWSQPAGGGYDLALTYPTDRPAEYTLTAGAETLRVLAMSDALADHTWFVPIGAENYVVCGPAYVGDATVTGGHLRLTMERGLAAANGITPYPYAESSPTLVYGAGMDGAALASPKPSAALLTAPALTGWEVQPVKETAPKFADAAWMASADPRPMGADGDTSAYAWYRSTLHAPSAGAYALAFSSANDRIIPFLDGKRVPETNIHHGSVDLTLTPGGHALAILATEYGRDKLFGYLGPLDTVDAKGLVGPARLRVAGGPGVALASWRTMPAPDGGDHAAPPAADATGWAAAEIGQDVFQGKHGFAWYETTLPADLPKPDAGGRQYLHFDSVDDNATVYVNGKQIAQHRGWNEGFDVLLDAAPAGEPVRLAVLVENTDGAGGLAGPVTVVTSRFESVVSGWRMRGGVEAGLSETAAWKPLGAGTTLSGAPQYFRASFTATPPAATGPHPILRAVMHGMSRGFVWLNGHNLGRYPEKIPVDGLYLPEPWLKAGRNTLVIFDEDGHRPEGVTLRVETEASRTVSEVSAR